MCAVDLWPECRSYAEHKLRDDLLPETQRHFLDDQVHPRLLAMQGDLVIHGGAVWADEAAVLFIARSGLGKSTLVASFDGAGHPLIGDDALVLTEQADAVCVRAVYPSLRLLPDSIDALFDSPPAADSIGHYTEKQRIDLPPAGPVAQGTRPVSAIFLLEPEQPDQQGISISPATAAEACMALIANSFEFDPTDTARAARKLARLAAIVTRVPAMRLSYPRDYSLLPQVRAAVLDAASRRGNSADASH